MLLAADRWSAASFHAQQAAEKALKALYRERKDEDPPRIHDLVRLAQELRVSERWLPELDPLSRVYLVTRYPGEAANDEPPYGIDGQAARDYAALAGKVCEWVQETLTTESSNA